ncbi:hypothetical protein WDU94_015501 [Cyamophila willieti]
MQYVPMQSREMYIVLLVTVTAVVAKDKKEDDNKTPGKRGIFSEGYGYAAASAGVLVDDIGYVNTDVVNRDIPVEKPVSYPVHIIPVDVARVPVEVTRLPVPVPRRVYVDRPADPSMGGRIWRNYGAGYGANYGTGYGANSGAGYGAHYGAGYGVNYGTGYSTNYGTGNSPAYGINYGTGYNTGYGANHGTHSYNAGYGAYYGVNYGGRSGNF